MVRRTTKYVVELFAALVTAAMILIGAAAWLVASGPVSLDIFKPTVAAGLARSLNVDHADFDAAYVEWVREEGVLQFRVRDVDLFNEAAEPVLSVPSLAVSLSAKALLRGLIAPTRVQVSGASARLSRDAQGRFGLGFLAPGSAEEGASAEEEDSAPAENPPADAAPETASEASEDQLGLLKQLMAPPDSGSVLGYLDVLEMRDARFEFDDGVSGVGFSALDASLRLSRGDDRAASSLSLALKADVAIGRDVVPVDVTGTQSERDDRLSLKIRFGDVDTRTIAEALPQLTFLEPLDLPLRGDATVILSQTAAVEHVEVALLAGPGAYDLPETDHLPIVEAEHMDAMLDFLPNQVPIRTFSFSAAFDPASGALTVNRAALRTDKSDLTLSGRMGFDIDRGEVWALRAVDIDLEGNDLTIDVPVYSQEAARLDHVHVSGRYDLETAITTLREARIAAHGGTIALEGRFGAVEGKPEVFLNGSVAGFPADKLKTVWPRGMAVGAREWIVKNISKGRIGEGTLKLEAPAGTFDVGYIPNEAMRFDFTLEGLTTYFVPGLPPMTDLDGSATLLGNRFEARFDTARIGRVAVSEGRMLTKQLNVRGSYGIFDAVAEGPLPDMLSLLDMGPFGYPSRYGIDPTATEGDGGVRLHVELPMRRNLKIEQIEFSAAAQVKAFALDAGPLLSVRDGDVALEINGAGLKGSGDLVVSDLPAHVVWTEDFTGKSDHPTVLSINTVLDDETRERLGITTNDIVAGAIRVATTAYGRGRNIARVVAEADLMGTVLRIPGTKWEKPADSPVKAKMDVRFGEDGGISVDEFSVGGEDVDVEGTFALGADLRLIGADFPRVKIGDLADLSAEARRDGEALALAVHGSYLNADPLLDLLDLDGEATSSPASASSEPSRVLASKGAGVVLKAEVARIDLKRDVTLSDASAMVRLSQTRLEDVTLRSRIGSSGTAHVVLTRQDPTHRTFAATATDAGALARGFLDTNAIAEGQLTLNALLTDAEDGGPDGGAIEGNLTIEEFRVVDAPLLARILTAGSPTGLGDLLQGDGIRFTALNLPFESRDGIWTLYDGRAFGPSIGITVDGGLDEDMQATDLRGTIVPAYGINSALGRVPLIGDVFVNREGEGLFAFTYRVVGSEEGSNIYVNPLSGLAPGFLRRLFEIGDGRSDEEEPSEPPEPVSPPEPEDDAP